MIIDCHNHVGADLLFYLRGDFPYAQQLINMHDEGRTLGIDYWITFPFVSYAALDLSRYTEDEIRYPGGIEDVPYALENRRMMREIYDLFPEIGKRMLPFVMVDPMRNTEEQAKELRRLRERYWFYGIKMQTTILRSDIKTLAREGKVFLQLAAEWNLPFLIHSSIAESDLWAQCSDILDIAEMNPHLRFLLAHSCRYDKPSLDRVNRLPNTWFDCSAHCIHCEGVVGEMPFVARPENRFPSDYSNPAQVIADLAAAYPDKFCWGSDSPFYSYASELNGQVIKLISTYQKETDALLASPVDVVKRIACTNTLKWLGLKPDELPIS